MAKYIVSFDNGFHFEAIFFGFSVTTSRPDFSIFNVNSITADHVSQSAIQLNEWTHLTFTFDQYFKLGIYVNANLAISSYMNLNQPLRNTTRILNYIGRGDFYPTQPVINAIIDELKIDATRNTI